jgi:hypothetical protein
MTLNSRLKVLEQQAGVTDSAECACYRSTNREIRTYMGAENNHVAADADVRPPEVCDECGKPKGLIKLVLVHSREQVRA